MKTIVVKIGGEIAATPEMDAIARDVRALIEDGHRVSMVHGGGPQATALHKVLGLETRMVAGRRYTDPATLDVMKYAVAGKVNVDVCARLLANGWSISPIVTFSSGNPFSVTSGKDNNYDGQSNDRANVTGDPVLDPNRARAQVLAWARATAGWSLGAAAATP